MKGHGTPCPQPNKGENMNLQEFQNRFKQECNKNNIKYHEPQGELLYQYMNLILEWNEKINVTAIKDQKEFIVKHFIDSLTILDFVKQANRVLDIGTGAGFPGIPLKLYYPEVEITLIDSVNKKVKILQDVIEKLDLQKIEALHIRAEELAQNSEYREKFDVVTTRAVSNLATISEYMLPFVKMGGKAICMKGPNVEQELEEAKKAIRLLGGEIQEIKKMQINEEMERNIVIIKKINHTDKKYPRGQGKPAKEPIQ